MANHNKLTVRAGDLADALKLVVKMPRRVQGRRKVTVISLEFVPVEGMLQVVEALHRAKVHRVGCGGSWVGRVQVDGTKLRIAIEKYSPDDSIQLIALPKELEIAFGKSLVRFPRVDPGGSGGVDATPLPADPKHRGPVSVAPDPVTKKVELSDTWDFSARVPMPQHRNPQDK